MRGATRERELSIRAALGAGRRNLIGYFFFEAMLLAAAAGAISALVLFGIPAVIGWRLGVPVPPEIDPDLTGIAISSGLCLLVSVLFGLLPALRFSRPSLIHAPKQDAGGGGRQNIRVHRVAALVQIGIAVPFLVVSGVMLDRVRTAELGFQTHGLAAARLPASAGPEREAGFAIRKVRDDLKHTAGVLSVAIAEGMPVDFDYRMFRVANTAQTDFVSAQVTRVGESFLETIVAGGLVLILAALGIVGVVGFMVATRTRELAVRMALGATRLRVLRMMLSDVVKLVIPGVAGGLLLGAVLIRTVENVMGTPLTVGPTPLGVMEPIIDMGAAAIAIAVALLAGLPAARRATTVQPMVAMRSE